jgi:hypothetical protein
MRKNYYNKEYPIFLIKIVKSLILQILFTKKKSKFKYIDSELKIKK